VKCGRALVALLALLALASPAAGYSVLSHEAAIDVVWDTGIKPLLLQRFPKTTPDQLMCARAFAYGGSVIQDLGYYPFGNRFFSNLLHYVRSGDFVQRLMSDARDVDEYAFALGALAHYANDNTGHPVAVNRALPIVYPKLREKYGDVVTYAEAPKEHVIVEFSFDIVQAAAGSYLPEAYRRFIGFEVATPFLERVFREIYSLEMKDVLRNEQQAISTYRFAVSQLVPQLTEAAWRDKREEIAKLMPGIEHSRFVFAFSRADYERAYGRDYQKPALMARFIAWLYRFVPKIGPLKPLSFKAPTPEAERLFAESFREAHERYAGELAGARARRVSLPNVDFDTGKPSRHGEYELADDTYAELLEQLSKHDFAESTPALRQNIRQYYGPRPQPGSSKHDRKHWKRIARDLAAMPD
jgi:hypothetical protein